MGRKFALITMVLLFILSLGATCPKQGDNVSLMGQDRELYMEAESLFEAGDYEAALTLYQKVLEDHPGSGWANKAQFRMGQCYFKLGKHDEALEEFQLYVENNRDDDDVTVAQDYVIKILQKKQEETIESYEKLMAGYELQNFRLDMLNKYLSRSVDSEVIYLELDLEANRVFVRMGTQTLYEYPVVSGKGRTRLAGTGAIKDFSTPKGIRQVEFIQKNPIWYRPDWAWLEAGEELPEEITMEDRAVPGVLGPYKVSIGESYYFHGTRRGTIRPGKYSHGCVRMNNKDLRQMVKLIEEGTVVYIY